MSHHSEMSRKSTASRYGHRVQCLVLWCVTTLSAGWLTAAEIGIPALLEPEAEGVTDLVKNGLDAWEVEDHGAISNWKFGSAAFINDKQGPHLLTKEKYRDFDLQCEFNLPKGGNSGVYLRGRYEVQLFDETKTTDFKGRTGAIWGQIPVAVRAYKGPNTWNELRVRLVGNSVSVLVNRVVMIRSAELRGPTQGALDMNENGPGPILLQSLHGVRFRKILIKQL